MRRAFGCAFGLWLVVACSGGGKTPDAGTMDGGADSSSVDAPSDAGVDGNSLPANAPPIGHCTDGWCWVYPLPQGYRLHGIWGTSATDVWAFGEYGTIMHYNGTSWTKHAAPANCAGFGGPVQAFGTSPNDLWIAGGCVLHWNGSTWTESTTGLTIGGISTTNLWTSGAGTTQHWDGTQWTTHPIPTNGWEPIAFGGSGSTTLMVSSAGGIAQWTGAAWGIADAGSHPANAAVVIDATHLVLAGSDGTVSFWDSGTWTTRTPPVTANWSAISARSLTDVWISGVVAGVPHHYHWNGVAWSAAAAAVDSAFPSALWQDPSGAPWVVALDGTVRTWSGTAWVAKTVGDNAVTGVWGTGWDDIWTVSSQLGGTLRRNRMLHWDGVAWSEAAFPTDATYYVTNMWASAPNDYWLAAGRRVTSSIVERWLFHWNGTSWSGLGPYGTEDLNVSRGFAAVWGTAANDVYAVARTALYHYDGNTWTTVAGVPGGTDVFGTASNNVYVVNGTQLWRWDGSSWTVKTIPTTLSAATRGWANSPTDVWLNGQPAFHFDGTLFVQYAPAVGGPLVGSSTHMFAFTSERSVSEWVGGFGATANTETGLLFPFSTWRTADGHIFAAGRGLVVR